MNIITITLNPAIDVHVRPEELFAWGDSPITVLERNSGGKGVNVSRALLAFGIGNLCCVTVGEDNAEEYLAPLEKIGMNLLVERVTGRVRTNAHANTPEGGSVVAGQGACVDNPTLLRIKKRILPVLGEGDFLCLCGGLPPECDKALLIDILLEFKSRGARIILDSRSLSADELRAVYPYMIKPNLDELRSLTASGNIGKEQAIALARELSGDIAENILLSLGEDGGAFVGGGEVYEISTPRISAVSTTGAGDSMIAGYLYAMTRKERLADVLRVAAAFGAASCLREGTSAPLPEDVERLEHFVSVVRKA